MKFKNVIYYISLILVSIFSLYISWIFALWYMIIAFFVYGNIFFIFHIILRKIRKKQIEVYHKYLLEFTKKVSFAFVLIFTILWSFSYYQNEINPAKMPEITISNGEKIVVFQAMSHIWAYSFYKQVKENLLKYKKIGFVYFFEWVKPGTKENMNSFNEAIWIEFDKDLYTNFSKLYGVSHQDNSIFLWLINNLDFNIDISIDEIIKLYKEKKIEKNETKKSKHENIPIDANKQILEVLTKLNDKELKILVYINRSILNFIIKSDNLQDFMTKNIANKDLFDVILDGRNKVIVRAIKSSSYDKMYITYGLMHFDWVFNLLKTSDNKWEIIKIKNLIPIK